METSDSKAVIVVFTQPLIVCPYNVFIDPPFSLTSPLTIRIEIKNSHIDTIDPTKSPDVASAIDPKDLQNLTLEVISNSTIRWSYP
ncbi:MAG: hypothetical protein WBX01_11670 [Nitrososphaeraceae archaeon]